MGSMATGACPASPGSDRAAAPTAELVPASLVTTSSTADFEAFVAAVLPKVLRLAYSLGARRADAEDIAAEALARAFASWGRVSSLDYRDGWVLRTASNLVYDRARRRLAEGQGPD